MFQASVHFTCNENILVTIGGKYFLVKILHLVELGDVLAVDADETLEVWLGPSVGRGEISVDWLDCPGWEEGGSQGLHTEFSPLIGRGMSKLGSDWSRAAPRSSYASNLMP